MTAEVGTHVVPQKQVKPRAPDRGRMTCFLLPNAPSPSSQGRRNCRELDALGLLLLQNAEQFGFGVLGFWEIGREDCRQG